MRIWLDDLREPPDDSWVWVTNIDEAIQLLQSGEVECLSLDNDLGEGIPEGRRLVLWMAEHECWPISEIAIHSANPVAADYMAGMIERYSGFKKELGGRIFKARAPA